jgi:hypothetical protein
MDFTWVKRKDCKVLLQDSTLVTDYIPRPSDNATIPSVRSLLTGWISQSKEQEIEIVKEIAPWLLQEINCLIKEVEETQNDIINRYQERLDRANQEITLDYEKDKNIWLPIQQKSQSLAEDFNMLGISLKQESET